MKLSIIVPIYNAEKYLQVCLESLVKNCPDKDVEIILVNDGSTDSSKSIAEKWAKCDERFILIDQANQGVSVARNRGIEAASGKYITFVDADDYLTTDYYKEILARLEDDTDMILFAHYAENPKHQFTEKQLPIDAGRKKVENRILRLPLTWKSNAVWDKIIKRSIVSEYNIRFPYGMKTSEDLLFFIDLMKYVKVYEYIPKPLYYYRFVETGAVRQFKPQYVLDLQRVYEKGTEYIKCFLDSSYYTEFSKVILWQYIGLIANANSKNIKGIKNILYSQSNSCIKELINSRGYSWLHRIYQAMFKMRCLLAIRIIFKFTTKVKEWRG